MFGPSAKWCFIRWIIPAFMLVMAAGLLVIGAPRLRYELALIPGTPIYQRLVSGQPVTDNELDTLEQTRLDALSFVETAQSYTELGTSYMARAHRTPDVAEKQRHATMAIYATMKGLQIAPLNTFAWARIATAHLMLGADHFEEALAAWRNSIASAQFEPILLIRRVHVGILLYGAMSEIDRALLVEQLAITWRWNRAQLLAYSKRHHLSEWMILLSGDDLEMVRAFQRQQGITTPTS